MRYYLSRQQLKRLSRGVILRIAIPAPEVLPRDLVGLVRQLLDVPSSIISARHALICVDAAERSEGLVKVFGRIDHPTPRAPIYMSVILADIGDVGGFLPKATQWPGKMQCDDGTWLPKETDGPADGS